MSPCNSTITRSFPLAVKLAYTAFVAVHVIFNWHYYGPVNFLWECDTAVLIILVAMWADSRLLTSVAALAVLVPMCLWIVDLGGRIVLGHYLFGFAGYMFDQRIPITIRRISFFHLWLPVLLAWMVYRVGYDRRAIFLQSLFMAILLITCRIFSQPPSPPPHPPHAAVNINWVYGTDDNAPQSVIPANAYLALMIVLYPLLIYMPTHFLLSSILCGDSKRRRRIRNLPAAVAL